jgi:hypothetical protein
MAKKYVLKLSAALSALAIAGAIVFTASCNKNKETSQTTAASHRSVQAATVTEGARTGSSRQVLTGVVTVAMLRASDDGRVVRAMFNENEQILNVIDDASKASLNKAFAANKPVQISYDPWAALIISVSEPSTQEQAALNARGVNSNMGLASRIDLANTPADVINDPAGMAIINTTDPGLTPVIPDMQTAQAMFDYITHQCCQLPGPYAVDHCITFQYCEDGCYARAHKMCWILNNKYKFATKKIFSFANAGHDELCVKAEKWGGCCINWWYHVAPLVTIKTPSGPKAFVFDPAMFDQPVLLSAWLHAQENPACVPSGDVPHVSMINIQPTSSYSPSGSTGMVFNTDPAYTSTNSTLTSYRYLISCP